MPPKPRSLFRWREIPGSVWALGLVSLFMDLSSEMIHALLPLYLVTVLGASTLTVGFIEGIAEATASITKIFSGALSDYLGKRKLLAALGYGLAAFTKPVFPLASSIAALTAARFVDRIGKGIRGAPRDALVADLTPADLRGTAFGLRQSLDTVGAVLGPLAAIIFMAMFANNFTTVFWIAVVPAFISVAVIVFGVREPERPPSARTVRSPFSRSELARLDVRYWMVVGVSAIFTLARFSEAFLLLRAQSVGMDVAIVPVVMVVMNIVYTASAWPAGALSDSLGRFGILVVGFALLVFADLVLAFGNSVTDGDDRCCVVGPAYGPDARAAGGTGRRYGARGTARHRLRHVQPGERDCVTGGQHYCRRALGHDRAERHIFRRRADHGGCAGGAAVRAREGSAEKLICRNLRPVIAGLDPAIHEAEHQRQAFVRLFCIAGHHGCAGQARA